LEISKARPLIIHPQLLLKLYTGGIGITQAHAEIEIRKAQRMYQRGPENLSKTIQALADGLCYNYKTAYLYAAVRRLEPDCVVETGVAAGVSSFSILQALEDNERGTLYSIDLPNVTLNLPGSQQPGFIVPNRLRKRWKIILGDARRELPLLLENLKTIDIFHHDSLHTYDHMLFEYEIAWSHLKHGGMLLSDDLQDSNVFHDLCSSKGV